MANKPQKTVSLPGDRQERLKLFAEKRGEWIELLQGHHPNSISNQIYSIAGDATFFNALWDLRRKAEERGEQINPTLLELIAYGYAHRQSLAIRRLVDRRTDVQSLRRIIEDMRAYRFLLIREAVVGHDGTPWDAASAESAYLRTIDSKVLGQQGASSVNPGDQILLHHWVTSDTRNKAFDRISEKGPEGHTEANDVMSDTVFARIIEDLESAHIKRVKRFVDKFLAHADDRVDPKDPTVSPTWQDIDESLATLVKVHRFLLSQVLYEAWSSVVPIPQFDVFENISQPFVSAADISSAYELWHRYAREIEDITAGDEAWSRFFVHRV